MFTIRSVRYPFLFSVPVIRDIVGLRGLFVKTQKNWPPDKRIMGHVLSVDPIIFCCQPQPWPFGAAHYFARRFPDKPIIFLMPITMSLERRTYAISLAFQHHRFRRAHPHTRLIMMSNTIAEEQLLRKLGVEVQLAPQNMFVNETMYHPIAGHERKFDAIYNAQLAPFKRHDLARLVSTCVYVTKMFSHWSPELKQEQLRGFIDGIPQGHAIANKIVADDVALMSHVEVNETMASAHVGLCLSKLEGAMYASIEYLLAGLPVVSTRSQGGRDAFFHPDTTLIVDDNPHAVQEGVAVMKARSIPPDFVRSTTLKLMGNERERFNNFIVSLKGETHNMHDSYWQFNYHHKLARSASISEFEAEISKGI